MNTNNEKIDDKKYIINPKSGRKILVNGKTYKQLVNENIIGNDKQVEGIVYKGSTKEEANKFKSGMKIPVSKNHVVKVRGNNVEIHRRRLKRQEIVEKSQSLALTIYKENSSMFNDQMSPSEVQKIIKELTVSKMIQPNFKTSTDATDIRLRYIVEQEDFDDDTEDEYYSETDSESDEGNLSTIEENQDDLNTDEDVLKDTTGEIAELTKSVGDLQAS